MQNRLTSAVSLGLLVLGLEAQTYHNFYRSGTNRSRFLVAFNTSWYALTLVSTIRPWRVCYSRVGLCLCVCACCYSMTAYWLTYMHREF